MCAANTTDSSHVIVWFKRDLRLSDHQPLHDAVASGLPVTALYIIEPDYWALPDTSDKHWAFIVDSLHELHKRLKAIGGHLVIRRGQAEDVLTSLQPKAIYAHEETGNAWTFERDKRVIAACKQQGIEFHESPNSVIIRRLSSRDDWSRLHKARLSEKPLGTPENIQCSDITGDSLPDKCSLSVQTGGRLHAIDLLKSFTQDRAQHYRRSISTPFTAQAFNSRLSAHIAYGTISVNEVFTAIDHRLSGLADEGSASAKSIKAGLKAAKERLHWRDHFMQKLESQPSIETHCMHPLFEDMRDRDNEEYLEEWFHGNTGIPIIDASMRCLHETGWVNFRMRAMVVSFASYHLWLDWRKTGPLLAQLFTDYEPGIHYSQLQMQSGVTGINALRMYNPIKQSYEKDPEGKFIRQYVPELSDLTNASIHEPWLFSDYPEPIVDLSHRITQARAEFKRVRAYPDFTHHSNQVYDKLGSRSRPKSTRSSTMKTNSKVKKKSVKITEESDQTALF